MVGWGDHDPFRCERIARLPAHQRRKLGGEHLQPVRVAEPHGGQDPSFATPLGTCPIAATPLAASQWQR